MLLNQRKHILVSKYKCNITITVLLFKKRYRMYSKRYRKCITELNCLATKIADIHVLFSPSTIHMGPQWAHKAHDPKFPFTILQKFPVTKHTPSIIIFGWGNSQEISNSDVSEDMLYSSSVLDSFTFFLKFRCFSQAPSLFLKALLLNHVPGCDCFCVLEQDSILAVQLSWLL